MERAPSIALRPKQQAQFKPSIVLRPKKNRAVQFKKIPKNSRKQLLIPRRYHVNNYHGPSKNSPTPKETNHYPMKLPGREEEEEEENGVLRVFREEQLGRNIFLLAIPISAGFVTYYNPVSVPLYGRLVILLVSLGSTAIWNGILLRRALPRVSIALELAGVALMLLAFFGYLGSHLPRSFMWLPPLCFLLSMIPIVVGAAFYCRRPNNYPPQDGDLPAAADAGFGIA